MINPEALAAGQGGTENNDLAPQSASAPHPQTEENPADHSIDEPLDDETQRRRVAGRLSDQLDLNVDLAAICEHLAGIPKKGRIEAVYAEARLTQANAQLARALAHLLKVERRQTTIVQHIQQRAPISNHSNSSEGLSTVEAELVDGLQSKIFRYLKLYADEILNPALEEAARREKYDDRDKENSAPAA